MSEKKCGHPDYQKRKFFQRVFVGVLSFIILILLVIFLVWIILRPQKPHFVLQDATVYAFNISSPNLLTSNIQITIASKNPNNLIGVYYQKMDVYVSYRKQQITLPTELPSTYQGHNDVIVWSPFVSGNVMPVAQYLGVALNEDQLAGMVLVNIKINGKLKWKVGTWMSGKYHIYVNCPAYLSFRSHNTGIPVGLAMKYQFDQGCTVDVGLAD